MLTTLKVKKYGSGTAMTFYLAVDTISFDYANMTRSCSVRLYIEGGEPGTVLRAKNVDGSVTIFGKTFVLPGSVTIGATDATEVGSWTVTGISNADYPESTICNISLTYSCDNISMSDHSASYNIQIGAMHLAPVVSVVGGNRCELGKFLGLSGDIFSEGYNINASVKCGAATYNMTSLQSKRNGFYSYDYWISNFKYSAEFDAVVTLSASYNGVPLPNTYALTVTFYLGEGAGHPQATVVTEVRSDNTAAQALGIGIKNKSTFFIDVSNISVYYSGELESCIITIDSQTYNSASAESPLLTESGQHNWSVTLRDSRKKTQTYNGTFTVHDYGPPEFSVYPLRTDAEGNENKNGEYISFTLVPQKEYLFDGLNTYSYSFCYRDVRSGNASAEIPISVNESVLYHAELQSGVAYEIVFKGKDTLGSETEKKYILESERVELSIARNRFAVGKKAQKDHVFECAWDIEGHGDVSFTDGDGVSKSIRSIYENEMPVCSLVSVSDESGITAAMQNVTGNARGCAITLINVENDGLSLEKGLNAYLSFRADGQTLIKKL